MTDQPAGRLLRRERVAAQTGDHVIAEVQYRLEVTRPLKVAALRQAIPTGWEYAGDDPRWTADGDAVVASPRVEVTDHLVVGLRLKAKAGAEPLPPLQLKADGPVQRPSPLAPPPVTTTAAPSAAAPGAAPPVPVTLEATVGHTARHASFIVTSQSSAPVLGVTLAVTGGATPTHPVGDIPPSGLVAVDVPADGPAPVTVTIASATAADGSVFDVSAAAPATSEPAAPPPTPVDFAAGSSNAAPPTPSPGGPSLAGAYKSPEEVAREQAAARQAAAASGPAEMVLAPRAGDVSAAGGKVDVVAVGVVEGSGTVDVGEHVEIGAVIGNGSSTDMQQIVVVAHIPGSVTVKDHRWEFHEPGAYRTTALGGLPVGQVVTVPIEVRIDRPGDLNFWFEVI